MVRLDDSPFIFPLGEALRFSGDSHDGVIGAQGVVVNRSKIAPNTPGVKCQSRTGERTGYLSGLPFVSGRDTYGPPDTTSSSHRCAQPAPARDRLEPSSTSSLENSIEDSCRGHACACCGTRPKQRQHHHQNSHKAVQDSYPSRRRETVPRLSDIREAMFRFVFGMALEENIQAIAVLSQTNPLLFG